MKIKIVLVESHLMMRDGLRSLLEKKSDFEVVGEAENGKQAIELAVEMKPDVVILDINLPIINGIEVTREIVIQNLNSKVIILSAQSEEKCVLEGISAGASGYVLKVCEFRELVNAINAVVNGMDYLCPQVASLFVKGFRNTNSNSSHLGKPILTKRERVVLQLIAEGYSSKEIASTLFLSARTVTSHRQNIMDKIGYRDIAMLTKYAIREGLTSIEK
jgi:two-component system, NarL family, response regulator NreC